MRLWRNDVEEPAAAGVAWARVGVVLTAVVSVALALAVVVAVVRGQIAGR